MSYKEVPLSTAFSQNENIMVVATYGCPTFLCPTEGELYQALQQHPYFAVSKVNRPLIATIFSSGGGYLEIYGKVSQDVNGEEIAAKVRDILSNFIRIYGVTVESISIDSFDLGNALTPSPSTAISLAAIAIIAIVLLIVFLKVT